MGVHDTNTVKNTKDLGAIADSSVKPLAQCEATAIKKIKPPMTILKIPPDDGQYHSQPYLISINLVQTQLEFHR